MRLKHVLLIGIVLIIFIGIGLLIWFFVSKYREKFTAISLSPPLVPHSYSYTNNPAQRLFTKSGALTLDYGLPSSVDKWTDIHHPIINTNDIFTFAASSWTDAPGNLSDTINGKIIRYKATSNKNLCVLTTGSRRVFLNDTPLEILSSNEQQKTFPVTDYNNYLVDCQVITTTDTSPIPNSSSLNFATKTTMTFEDFAQIQLYTVINTISWFIGFHKKYNQLVIAQQSSPSSSSFIPIIPTATIPPGAPQYPTNLTAIYWKDDPNIELTFKVKNSCFLDGGKPLTIYTMDSRSTGLLAQLDMLNIIPTNLVNKISLASDTNIPVTIVWKAALPTSGVTDNIPGISGPYPSASPTPSPAPECKGLTGDTTQICQVCENNNYNFIPGKGCTAYPPAPPPKMSPTNSNYSKYYDKRGAVMDNGVYCGGRLAKLLYGPGRCQWNPNPTGKETYIACNQDLSFSMNKIKPQKPQIHINTIQLHGVPSKEKWFLYMDPTYKIEMTQTISSNFAIDNYTGQLYIVTPYKDAPYKDAPYKDANIISPVFDYSYTSPTKSKPLNRISFLVTADYFTAANPFNSSKDTISIVIAEPTQDNTLLSTLKSQLQSDSSWPNIPWGIPQYTTYHVNINQSSTTVDVMISEFVTTKDETVNIHDNTYENDPKNIVPGVGYVPGASCWPYECKISNRHHNMRQSIDKYVYFLSVVGMDDDNNPYQRLGQKFIGQGPTYGEMKIWVWDKGWVDDIAHVDVPSSRIYWWSDDKSWQTISFNEQVLMGLSTNLASYISDKPPDTQNANFLTIGENSESNLDLISTDIQYTYLTLNPKRVAAIWSFEVQDKNPHPVKKFMTQPSVKLGYNAKLLDGTDGARFNKPELIFFNRDTHTVSSTTGKFLIGNNNNSVEWMDVTDVLNNTSMESNNQTLKSPVSGWELAYDEKKGAYWLQLRFYNSANGKKVFTDPNNPLYVAMQGLGPVVLGDKSSATGFNFEMLPAYYQSGRGESTDNEGSNVIAPKPAGGCQYDQEPVNIRPENPRANKLSYQEMAALFFVFLSGCGKPKEGLRRRQLIESFDSECEATPVLFIYASGTPSTPLFQLGVKKRDGNIYLGLPLTFEKIQTTWDALNDNDTLSVFFGTPPPGLSTFTKSCFPNFVLETKDYFCNSQFTQDSKATDLKCCERGNLDECVESSSVNCVWQYPENIYCNIWIRYFYIIEGDNVRFGGVLPNTIYKISDITAPNLNLKGKKIKTIYIQPADAISTTNLAHPYTPGDDTTIQEAINTALSNTTINPEQCYPIEWENNNVAQCSPLKESQCKSPSCTYSQNLNKWCAVVLELDSPLPSPPPDAHITYTNNITGASYSDATNLKSQCQDPNNPCAISIVDTTDATNMADYISNPQNYKNYIWNTDFTTQCAESATSSHCNVVYTPSLVTTPGPTPAPTPPPAPTHGPGFCTGSEHICVNCGNYTTYSTCTDAKCKWKECDGNTHFCKYTGTYPSSASSECAECATLRAEGVACGEEVCTGTPCHPASS